MIESNSQRDEPSPPPEKYSHTLGTVIGRRERGIWKYMMVGDTGQPHTLSSDCVVTACRRNRASLLSQIPQRTGSEVEMGRCRIFTVDDPWLSLSRTLYYWWLLSVICTASLIFSPLRSVIRSIRLLLCLKFQLVFCSWNTFWHDISLRDGFG